MKRIIALLSGAFLLSACAAMEPAPEDHFYRLAPNPVTPAGIHSKRLIEVDRFSADGITGSRSLTYTTDANPTELAEFHYHYWAEPPALLLQSSLVTHIRQYGLGEATTPEMRTDAEYRVSGRIKAFEIVRDGNDRGVVVLEMALIRLKDREVLINHEFRKEVDSDGSVADGARAINRAVDKAFVSFVEMARRKVER